MTQDTSPNAAPQSPEAPKLSAVENYKAGSDYLGGEIRQRLDDAELSHLEDQEVQLLKHHGVYQQDDRDLRAERRKAKQDKAWSFMVRTRMPGGRISPEQYLALDDLCDRYANSTLRATSRQGFQFHGVGKDNLVSLIKALNHVHLTTLAACGDVARNVMSNPVSDIALDSPCNLQPLAEQLSKHFLPRTESYFDVWLDGEKLSKGHFEDLPEPACPIGLKEGPEPLYGPTYMPRKFKIGLGWAADNHIDIYTQDVGVEAVPNDGGFNIIVGGGLGQSHGKEETYPRVGDRFAWVATEREVVEVCEAVLKVQRDFGDRENRKHARMKYLVADWGLEKFRAEVEKMLGRGTEPARAPEGRGQEYRIGWAKQKQNGLHYVGIWIENGRIRDYANGRRVRSGLRAILKEFPGIEMRMTAHHNAILVNIKEADKPRIQELMSEYGLSDGSDIGALRAMEMACPALPTCGLALAEAERHLPSLLDDLEAAGYGDEEISLRMAGCPNSCSRPPSAEIGLLGRAPGKYNIYLGGSHSGDRYNWLWRETVAAEDIVGQLAPVIDRWRAEGKPSGEAFGDWCDAHAAELR